MLDDVHSMLYFVSKVNFEGLWILILNEHPSMSTKLTFSRHEFYAYETELVVDFREIFFLLLSNYTLNCIKKKKKKLEIECACGMRVINQRPAIFQWFCFVTAHTNPLKRIELLQWFQLNWSFSNQSIKSNFGGEIIQWGLDHVENWPFNWHTF